MYVFAIGLCQCNKRKITSFISFKSKRLFPILFSSHLFRSFSSSPFLSLSLYLFLLFVFRLIYTMCTFACRLFVPPKTQCATSRTLFQKSYSVFCICIVPFFSHSISSIHLFATLLNFVSYTNTSHCFVKLFICIYNFVRHHFGGGRIQTMTAILKNDQSYLE